jgi:tetratricopeptide (TPR) repeat protein
LEEIVEMSYDSLRSTASRFRTWWLGSSFVAYLTRAGGTIAFAIAVREGLAQFDLAPFPVTGPGMALFVMSTVAVYFCGEFFRLLLHVDDAKPADLASAFLRHLDFLLKEHKHEAVVRYHAALSRLLWVEGQLQVRVEIGKRILAAAAAINDSKTLTGVLIDDLGWTYVALKEYEEARSNITLGIEIADETHEYYWSAKGHRHLAGIAVQLRLKETASAEFTRAREIAERIESAKTRTEMLAGIDLGEAEFYLDERETERALKLLDESEERRKQVGDESRIVKVYALRGKIAESLGQTPKAAAYFQRGLAEATKIGRVDEQIRCKYGLARIEKDPEQKRRLEAEASELKARTPITYDNR